MNSFMGARDPKIGPVPPSAKGYVLFYAKDSEIQRPSALWVLLDEDERSINDGFFVTDPTGQKWIDFPANSAHRHDFSFGLVFGDSHATIWRNTQPARSYSSADKLPQPSDADLKRLAGASVTKE
jgi:hypothetical protein